LADVCRSIELEQLFSLSRAALIFFLAPPGMSAAALSDHQFAACLLQKNRCIRHMDNICAKGVIYTLGPILWYNKVVEQQRLMVGMLLLFFITVTITGYPKYVDLKKKS
jgi:hypothetical protein